MFERKKKKTGCETPEFRSTVPMPPIKPARLKLPSTTSVVCLIKRGTTEDYKKYNPVLELNELSVEYDSDKIVGYKLGDGISRWLDLEYITNLTDLKEFWLYCGDINDRYMVAKIVLNPFLINNSLGGTEECSEQ